MKADNSAFIARSIHKVALTRNDKHFNTSFNMIHLYIFINVLYMFASCLPLWPELS
jgi:hypothetical protein